jgi:hypothetical protein
MTVQSGMCMEINFVSAHGHHNQYGHRTASDLPSSSSFLFFSSVSSPPSPTCCLSTVTPSPSSSYGHPLLLASRGGHDCLHVLKDVALRTSHCVHVTESTLLVFKILSNLKSKVGIGALTSLPSSGPPSRLVVVLRLSSRLFSSGSMPSVGLAASILPSKPIDTCNPTTFVLTVTRSPLVLTITSPVAWATTSNSLRTCPQEHGTGCQEKQQRVGNQGRGHVSL